ncbi:MAG: hypothetical protein ACRYFS_20165 [Janthinobacterium lividum]
MKQYVNLLEDCDEETALFMEEMEGEEQNLRKILSRGGIPNLPREVSIDQFTLGRLMQRHNQAMAMLREFLVLHPEKSDLVSRARQLTENPK